MTVVSGAPGTGKSHTIAAIACDAVARGERVLVAARSSATVDALTELLAHTGSGSGRVRVDRAAGPAGGSARRRSGLPAPAETVRRAAGARDEAIAARDAARAEVVGGLHAELSWEHAQRAHHDAWSVAPGLLEPDVELTTSAGCSPAVTAAMAGGGGAASEGPVVGRPRPSGPGRPGPSAASARRRRGDGRRGVRAGTLDTAGGLDLAAVWARLEPLDEAARVAIGRWLAVEARSAQRINQRTIGALGALATALRSGRAARREQLAHLDVAALTTALPLWIGTLADIDDLLPARPASFDLVMLDEASSIDQSLAATALLRARRTVIVGDPTSFVTCPSSPTIRASGAGESPGRGPRVDGLLDVRRNSIFDVAAGSGPSSRSTSTSVPIRTSSTSWPSACTGAG